MNRSQQAYELYGYVLDSTTNNRKRQREKSLLKHDRKDNTARDIYLPRSASADTSSITTPTPFADAQEEVAREVLAHMQSFHRFLLWRD